jgi:hypothetical protein
MTRGARTIGRGGGSDWVDPQPRCYRCQAVRPGGQRPSQWVEAALEQAELVAFWIGEYVPGRLRRLTDVDEFGPGGQQALEFGGLIAVGGVDVNVQPGS